MNVALVRTSFNAVVGMLLGYALWLAAGAVVILTLPVQYWAAAAGVLLVAFTVLALAAARRCPNRSTATMIRWSPLLPGLVSAYLLVLALT